MHFQLDDLAVNYEVHGEGRPIVLLHGWGMDHGYEATDYEPVFAGRPGWRRIYPDLPGMGATPARDWIKSQDDFLEVVLRFIEHVSPDGPVTLAGTSAGGYLAMGVVHRRPELVEGLLLRVPVVEMDRSARDLPAQRTLLADPGFVATLGPDEAEVAAGALVQTPRYVEAAGAALRDKILPALARADEPFLDAIGGDPSRYGFTFDVTEMPVPFDRPALVLAGRQDTIAGYRDAWRVLENFPRATMAVIDRADHALPVDNEPLFHALVTDWLDRVEEMEGR